MPAHRPRVKPHRLYAGSVGLRVIRPRDAARMGELLRANRSWLQEWEATHPDGYSVAPGSTPYGPVIKSMRQNLKAGTGIPWVITYNDEVVGQLNAAELSGGALRSGQLGYWIAEGYAGKGIVPTAVALAIDYLFDYVHLHRIEICIRPENQASLRVVEKLGLRYEGCRRAYIHIGGQWRDHECFAITREEREVTMLERLRR